MTAALLDSRDRFSDVLGAARGTGENRLQRAARDAARADLDALCGRLGEQVEPGDIELALGLLATRDIDASQSHTLRRALTLHALAAAEARDGALDIAQAAVTDIVRRYQPNDRVQSAPYRNLITNLAEAPTPVCDEHELISLAAAALWRAAAEDVVWHLAAEAEGAWHGLPDYEDMRRQLGGGVAARVDTELLQTRIEAALRTVERPGPNPPQLAAGKAVRAAMRNAVADTAASRPWLRRTRAWRTLTAVRQTQRFFFAGTSLDRYTNATCDALGLPRLTAEETIHARSALYNAADGPRRHLHAVALAHVLGARTHKNPWPVLDSLHGPFAPPNPARGELDWRERWTDVLAGSPQRDVAARARKLIR